MPELHVPDFFSCRPALQNDFRDADYSPTTTSLLPSLGARDADLLHHRKLRKHTISPFHPRYRWWQNLLIFLVVYSAWVTPLEMAFTQDVPCQFQIIDYCVDAFFLADIILTFFVAYVDKPSYVLVDHKSKIATKYLSTWFFFDAVSTLPVSLIVVMCTGSLRAGLTYSFLNSLRFWRLRHFSNLFARLEKDVRLNYFWIRLVKLVFVTVLAVHSAACFFYGIANRQSDETPTWIGAVLPNFKEHSVWIRYAYSLYWSTTSITTVGYGDLHPQNPEEMGFAIFYMLFNLGLTAYIIGNITYWVLHVTSRTSNFRDSIQAVTSFASRNHLPARLQVQMREYMRLKFRTDLEYLQPREETMSLLPKAVQSRIAEHLFLPTVEKVHLFQGSSSEFMLQLVAEMKAHYFPPDEDIILHDESPSEFYIIVSGTVELLVWRDGNEQLIGTAKAGDAIGEIGALCCRPQPYTARTTKLTQLLRIDRRAFLSIIEGNPADGKLVIDNFYRYLKESKISSILLMDLSTKVSMRADKALSLCLVTSWGNGPLLDKLLKKGRDPNLADYCGRTPLHIAATNGFVDCVQILLSHGAHPNIQDDDGVSPLYKAIESHHEAVAELLWRHGANCSTYGMEGEFLCRAVDSNSLEMLATLLKYGANINATNSEGSTALHTAITGNKTEVAGLLIAHGADVSKVDARGATPANQAKMHNQRELVELCLEKQRRAEEEEEERMGGGGNSPDPNSLLKMVNMVPCYENSCRTSSFFQDRPRWERSVDSPSTAATEGRAAIRVTIYRHHPAGSRHPGMLQIGKLINLPPSLEDLFQLAGEEFHYRPIKILSANLAEISSLSVIRDDDLLYLVDEDEFRYIIGGAHGESKGLQANLAWEADNHI